MQHRNSKIICIVVVVILLFGSGLLLGVEAGNTDRQHAREMRIIAHRAGASYAPENTLAALERTIMDGASIAEVDVQQLKDGTLIVMHDSNFRRTTGVDKNVWEVDLEELQSYDAGSYFSDEYVGEHIPTLEEMLRYADNRICLMLELKYTGREMDLEESVLQLLYQYGMERTCIIGSMNSGILERMKELDSDIATVFIAHSLTEEQYKLDYVDSYSIEAKNMTLEMVKRIHAQNKPVYGWTVNNLAAMDGVADMGADGIVTDNVVLARKFLWKWWRRGIQ